MKSITTSIGTWPDYLVNHADKKIEASGKGLQSRFTRLHFAVLFDIHPKTLIEMWIICLDRVSANSEKGRGSEWAVRVGQRLQSRFGQSGAAREMNLVQIVVEASAIRGVLPNTQPTQPVFGWCCSQRFGGL